MSGWLVGSSVDRFDLFVCLFVWLVGWLFCWVTGGSVGLFVG